MKTGIIFSGIAIALTCLTLTSCGWFTKKKTEQSTLIGKWLLVSVIDSSKEHPDSISFVDSNSSKKNYPIIVEFKKDNSFTVNQDSAAFFAANNSGKYVLDSTLVMITWKEDTLTWPLTIKQLTDSTLDLFSLKDSLVCSLKKIK